MPRPCPFSSRLPQRVAARVVSGHVRVSDTTTKAIRARDESVLCPANRHLVTDMSWCQTRARRRRRFVHRRPWRRLAPDGERRAERSSEAERVVRARAGRQEHALRLEIQLERLDPELAAEARLLVAAERDTREGGVGHVDADGTGLDPRREPVAARGI